MFLCNPPLLFHFHYFLLLSLIWPSASCGSLQKWWMKQYLWHICPCLGNLLSCLYHIERNKNNGKNKDTIMHKQQFIPHPNHLCHGWTKKKSQEKYTNLKNRTGIYPRLITKPCLQIHNINFITHLANFSDTVHWVYSHFFSVIHSFFPLYFKPQSANGWGWGGGETFLIQLPYLDRFVNFSYFIDFWIISHFNYLYSWFCVYKYTNTAGFTGFTVMYSKLLWYQLLY